MSHGKHHRKTGRKARRRTPPGASPGTIHVDPDSPKPVIRVIGYSDTEIVETQVETAAAVRPLLLRFSSVWVNVDGLGDAATIRELGEIFGLHKLALEDVVNTHQRPKIEQYRDNLYLVSRMASLTDHLATEQVSLFLGKTWVVTFQETVGDCFDPVRDRLRSGKGRIRIGGPDYLAYALLDAIVDNFFPLLETYGERIETLEEEILTQPAVDTLVKIHRIKRDLLTLRRAIWPMREALSSLVRDPSDLVGEETRLYLRDCYDHSIQIMDLMETYRELSTGLVEGYMSAISNRMNEVMKVLTIIATIFIPLTFLVGVYGMNFENMPELGWRWAYPAVWGVMVLTALLLILYFRRKGWLGRLVPEPKDLKDGPDSP